MERLTFSAARNRVLQQMELFISVAEAPEWPEAQRREFLRIYSTNLLRDLENFLRVVNTEAQS